jgi:hypothetical protein
MGEAAAPSDSEKGETPEKVGEAPATTQPPAATPAVPGGPGEAEGSPPADGAEPAATEEIPKPEPPRKLKFGLYWVYRGDQWLLDLKMTIGNTH